MRFSPHALWQRKMSENCSIFRGNNVKDEKTKEKFMLISKQLSQLNISRTPPFPLSPSPFLLDASALRSSSNTQRQRSEVT